MAYDFRQKSKERFIVHVYKVTGNHNEYFYKSLELAKIFADRIFKNNPGVYKVKIWDSTLGKIEPNRHDAVALVYELV